MVWVPMGVNWRKSRRGPVMKVPPGQAPAALVEPSDHSTKVGPKLT